MSEDRTSTWSTPRESSERGPCRIRGLGHVALSVISFERSIAFYRGLLRMELVTQVRLAGDRYETILGLQNIVGRVALLRARCMQLELFEFVSPAPTPLRPERTVCDHGITHFAIEVIDVESEYERLRMAGVRFHSRPVSFAGSGKAVYGRDPDSNVFELLEVASGTPR